jgi:hypothetical protein
MDRNLFLALTLSATFQCLAQTPEPFELRRAEPVFEELPELKVSEILKPELLKGPHFVVRDPVPTASGPICVAKDGTIIVEPRTSWPVWV